MKHKTIILSLLLLLCSGGLTFWFLLQDNTAAPARPPGRYQNITDLDDAYNASEEIAAALERIKTQPEKAAVITASKKTDRQIALTFDGLSDRTTTQQLLDILYKHSAKATFFVQGSQTAEDPQIVINIKKDGHQIENYSLVGMAKMQSLTTERLISDFTKSQKIINITTEHAPKLLKCNDTVYTEALLQAARASGITAVVKSDVELDIRQIASPAAAEQFVRGLSPGNIVSVKLSSLAEPIRQEERKNNDRPAIDKQPGLKELPKPDMSGKKEIITAVNNLLTALTKAKYTAVDMDTYLPPPPPGAAPKTGLLSPASLIRELLAGLFAPARAYAAEAPPQEIKIVYTTEPAIAYTFGGLTNDAAARDVLQRLQNLDIKATFFVTELEMKRYPQLVRQIIQNGHEIGIAIRPKDDDTEEITRQTLLRSFQLLQSQFGVETALVRQSSGAITDATRQAVAGANAKLISQSVNVVQSKHQDYTTAEQVMSELFGKAVYSLSRGQIVHFRMDYYTNPQLTGDMLEIIKARKIDNITYAVSFDNPGSNPANDSAYHIKPVGAMLSNTAFLYQYPADPAKIPMRLRATEIPVKLDSGSFMDEAKKRYIGHEHVDIEDRMNGFSKREDRRLDKSGLIHTHEPVVFFTFDDWGTDAAVNKLLYVLRKHRVPGNFFVITNNVLNNPNLLRAIAAEGHDVGSHSDKHRPMSILDPKTGKQIPTQSSDEFFQDITTSYGKLLAVTGDVVIDGKPALNRFFRPPTLAVSKMGFQNLFAAGYEYIISGSISTNDYKAHDVPELVKTLKDGLYTPDGKLIKGTVLVMHMGDTSVYTAMALDILLTANEAKADTDPTKFKVGRLSDYVTDGYSQMNRSHSLSLSAPD